MQLRVTVSVSWTLSASERPALWTLSVKVPGAPPAVTVVGANVFAIDRCTSSWTAVLRLLLVSFAVSGSVVPPEATVARVVQRDRAVDVEASVTWIVNVLSAPTGRGAVSAQVTVWPAAEQPAPPRRSGRCPARR